MDSLETWVSQGPGRNTAGYVNEWIGLCENSPTIISAAHDGVVDEILSRSDDLDRFSIHLITNKEVKFSGKFIDLLRATNCGKVTLENCTVRNLALDSNTKDVTLIDCKIGRLDLRENSLNALEIKGGCINNITAPTPSQQSPFTGSVEVRGVNLSSDFRNSQAYRNLRHHLNALHNHEAASFFHAAELKTEFSKHGLVDKIISVVYRSASNFGGSSGRPLLIFVFIVAVHVGVLFATDGVVLIGDVTEAEGWRYELYGLDDHARFFRSLIFALSQSFNPLGIFGARLLLAARTMPIAITSAILGVSSAITFALFVLAVRRRFRLDRGG